MATAPITVVLADDHPIILAGLENLFQRERDFKVVARCTDGVEAVRAVEKHQPAVLVLDLNMPRMHGVMVLREIAKTASPTRTVVLAAELEEDQLLEALRLGVRGVVLKEMAPQLLLQCVREVAAGRQWLEKKSVGQALDKLLRHEAAARELTQKLTPREVEIAKAIGGGLRNKEIAERLNISEGTVKIHLHTIYSKLGVDGRMALLLHLKERAFV